MKHINNFHPKNYREQDVQGARVHCVTAAVAEGLDYTGDTNDRTSFDQVKKLISRSGYEIYIDEHFNNYKIVPVLRAFFGANGVDPEFLRKGTKYVEHRTGLDTHFSP